MREELINVEKHLKDAAGYVGYGYTLSAQQEITKAAEMVNGLLKRTEPEAPARKTYLEIWKGLTSQSRTAIRDEIRAIKVASKHGLRLQYGPDNVAKVCVYIGAVEFASSIVDLANGVVKNTSASFVDGVKYEAAVHAFATELRAAFCKALDETQAAPPPPKKTSAEIIAGLPLQEIAVKHGLRYDGCDLDVESRVRVAASVEGVTIATARVYIDGKGGRTVICYRYPYPWLKDPIKDAIEAFAKEAMEAFNKAQ